MCRGWFTSVGIRSHYGGVECRKRVPIHEILLNVWKQFCILWCAMDRDCVQISYRCGKFRLPEHCIPSVITSYTSISSSMKTSWKRSHQFVSDKQSLPVHQQKNTVARNSPVGLKIYDEINRQRGYAISVSNSWCKGIICQMTGTILVWIQ